MEYTDFTDNNSDILLTPVVAEIEEEKIDMTLRPQGLFEFVGQNHIKEDLNDILKKTKVFIALKRWSLPL